jgi:hypothetical protein
MIPLSASGLVFNSIVDKEVWKKGFKHSDGLQDILPNLDHSPLTDSEYWANLYKHAINRNQMKPSYHIQRTFHWAHLLPESIQQASVRVPSLAYVASALDATPQWQGQMSGFSLDFADKVKQAHESVRTCGHLYFIIIYGFVSASDI